jgi:hypothetical protein
VLTLEVTAGETGGKLKGGPPVARGVLLATGGGVLAITRVGVALASDWPLVGAGLAVRAVGTVGAGLAAVVELLWLVGFAGWAEEVSTLAEGSPEPVAGEGFEAASPQAARPRFKINTRAAKISRYCLALAEIIDTLASLNLYA